MQIFSDCQAAIKVLFSAENRYMLVGEWRMTLYISKIVYNYPGKGIEKRRLCNVHLHDADFISIGLAVIINLSILFFNISPTFG